MELLHKFLSYKGSARRIITRCLNLWFWWVLISVAIGALSQFVEFVWIFVVLGLAQWLVLRRYIQRASEWIFATILGGCIGFGAKMIIFLFFKELFWHDILGSCLMWAVVGAIQGLVLQERVEHPNWWVLASFMAGALVGTVRVMISSVTHIAVLGTTMGWLAYGAVTGSVLVWLLQERIKRRVPAGATF